MSWALAHFRKEHNIGQKADIQQNSVCSEPKIYPSLENLHEQRSACSWHFACLPGWLAATLMACCHPDGLLPPGWLDSIWMACCHLDGCLPPGWLASTLMTCCHLVGWRQYGWLAVIWMDVFHMDGFLLPWWLAATWMASWHLHGLLPSGWLLLLTNLNEHSCHQMWVC